MLARPLLLAALVALPVLWLLARRAETRRALTVPSLLIWRRIGLTPEPPDSMRRRTDLLLLLRLAAAAAIAFGLAGPRLVPEEPPKVLHVLIDTSPSMGAFSKGAAAALARIEALAGDAEVVAHRRDGLSDLGSILARAGEGTVVVVTDHLPEGMTPGPRVRPFLVGEEVANAGIVSAWLEEGRCSVVVRNFSRQPKKLTVRFGVISRTVEIEPEGEALVTEEATGGSAEVILSPGDRFPFDDSVTLVRIAPVTVGLAWTGPDEPRTRLALDVAGVGTKGGAGKAVYRGSPDAATKLLIAPEGPRRGLRGALAGGGGLAPAAVPPPGLPLGRVAPLGPGGTPLLSDGTGPIAVLRDGRVEIALDPGDPESRWTADPSFPVFVAEVARLLGASPAGTRITQGMIDPEESGTRAESRPPDLSRLEPSFAETPEEGFDFAPWLFVAAAFTLVAHLLLERRPVSPGMLSSAR